jgi:hypothetical protein
MRNYLSVCTCTEGCEPRTDPKDCPMHGPQPTCVLTTNVPDDAPCTYLEVLG